MIAFVLVQKPTQIKAAGFLFCGDTHQKKTKERKAPRPVWLDGWLARPASN